MKKCGLLNLGTECYINSCTQILVNLSVFNDIHNKNISQNNNIHNILLNAFNDLRILMNNTHGIINHRGWINSIKHVARQQNNVEFQGEDQCDLPEFLLFIIDNFHEALSRKVMMTVEGTVINNNDKLAKQCYEMIKARYESGYSEIIDLFYGIHFSEIISQSNKTLSVTSEPFMILDLALPQTIKQPSIYNCLDHYYNQEFLSGDSAWFNETTNQKENVYKKLTSWSFPKILIISLKRFNNISRKDKRLVTYPLYDLDLTKYSSGYFSSKYKYNLYAVCDHSGGVRGGHYTCKLKKNNIWLEFNDTIVTEINENKIITTKSYCLFYQLIDKEKNIQ